MSWEQKELTGSLFKNDRNDMSDYNGHAMIDGVEYWVNGWKKGGGANGWLSLTFKPKEARRRSEPKQSLARELDDEIPF